jgi:hypothetical protein
MNISRILRRRLASLAVCAFVLTCFVAPASAGTITSALPAVGPGLGFVAVPAIVTLTPDNDNVPAAGVGDNNIVVPLKRFDNNGVIDIEFTVAPSNGVTEYVVSEFVDNNTGLPWIGYNMFLGYGVGAAFTPLAGDGLDFDFPTYDTPPTSGAFPAWAPLGEDGLAFFGGLHASGAQQYVVRIDVPNIATVRLSRFTLRQVPVPIPEPGTIALACLALASGLVIGRRR